MIDIDKNKQLQDKLNNRVLEEIFSELTNEFIQFSNSGIVNYSLQEIKSARKTELSARVLNNWIGSSVIGVDPSDKGKIKRFDKLEKIWLNIVVEARKFGVSLDYLKQARKELFESPIKDFSLIKFHVLDSILRSPKILVILENGHVRLLSYEVYNEWVTSKLFPTHISFRLIDFITPEFDNQLFIEDFSIEAPYENLEKMKLLYYLKTGDYKSVKLFVDEFDVRLIESSNLLLENKYLMKIISSWKFHSAEVVVDENISVMIKP